MTQNSPRSVIYCDESCHLENDQSLVMGLGAIRAPRNFIKLASEQIRDIKKRHNALGELKWIKVSHSRYEFYQECVEWFFNQEPLSFRALIVPNKQILDHKIYNEGSHDEFIYKMYYSLLNKMLSVDGSNEIYIDIKDTRSRAKIAKLQDVLCNDRFDFTRQLIDRIQHIRSHESELMQFADLLLGAVVYRNRGLRGNKAKLAIVERLEEHLRRRLTSTFPLYEQKFNVFVWQHR